MDKPNQSGQEGTATNGKDGPMTSLKFSEIMANLKTVGDKKQIELQLHWSEYLNGEWSVRRSGAFTPVAATVSRDFDPKKVFNHVTKEAFTGGGVRIHLKSADGAFDHSFLLASRNCAPEKTDYLPAPVNPYSKANTENATRFSGSGALQVVFNEQITTESGKQPAVNTVTMNILELKPDNVSYTLLPCNNDLILGAPETALLGMVNPAAVAAAMASGLEEIASLIKPVFYQDNAHTFFIEPNATEETVEKWEQWVRPARSITPDLLKNILSDIKIAPTYPYPWRRPQDLKIHPDVLIDPNPVPDDWLVNQFTVFDFDGNLIVPAGNFGITVKETRTGGIPTRNGRFVDVSPGSGMTPGGNVLLAEADAIAQSGLDLASGALNIVGRAGLNAMLKQNIIQAVGAVSPGTETAGR